MKHNSPVTGRGIKMAEQTHKVEVVKVSVEEQNGPILCGKTGPFMGEDNALWDGATDQRAMGVTRCSQCKAMAFPCQGAIRARIRSQVSCLIPQELGEFLLLLLP